MAAFTTAGMESVSWALICWKKKDGFNTFQWNIMYDVVWLYTAWVGVGGIQCKESFLGTGVGIIK